jgi:hypothetical protein
LQKVLTAAAEHEYDPEQDQVPADLSDVPPDVAQAVQAERERFAGFGPASASTELGKDIQSHTNTSGRNVDTVIKHKAAKTLEKFRIDTKHKPN